MDLQSEVQDLISRYAWAADSGDVEGYVECFTEDGVFAIKDVEPAVGAAAIRIFYQGARKRRVDAGQRTQHVMTNLVVVENADGATAKSYLTLITREPDGSTSVERGGEYQDVLIKKDGRWLFAERSLVFL
jgi:uncharacterized protein (TIGR02246 family)